MKISIQCLQNKLKIVLALVAISSFLPTKIHAQNFCTLYEMMLDTLKQQKATYFNIGDLKINPTNFVDTFQRKDTTYYYSFFIPQHKYTLTANDLKYWMFEKLNTKKMKAKHFTTVKANIQHCSFNQSIKYQLLENDGISPMFELPKQKNDKLPSENLYYKPLRLWFSDMLTKKNNAFAYVKCRYPFNGNHTIQYYFWFKRNNKFAEWKIFRMISEPRY